MTERAARLVAASAQAGRVTWPLLLLLVFVLALPFAFGSCAPFQSGAGREDDPADRMSWAMLGGPRGSRALRGGTFPVPLPPPRPPGPAHAPEEKLHPQLLLLLGSPSGTMIEVLVTFRDTLQIPRFPERVPPGDEDFDEREQAVAALIQEIRDRRAGDYGTLEDSLETGFGATVKDRDSHWMLRAMVMNLPVDRLLPLASWREVVYIQPRFAGERPPGGPNSNSDDDIEDARRLLACDPYYAAYASGTIGLIDTGVFPDHDLLAPGGIGETWSCLTAACVVETGSNREACPSGTGHGTGSAALLSANAAMSATHQGLTKAVVNSYRAYRAVTSGTTCSAELDGNAAVLGIQKAVERGDRVILVETQSTATGWAAIAQEADRAYRSGSVVIAPVGNMGYNNVGSPGNARGTIAVGAYDVENGVWNPGPSFGMCERRFKPDLEAPSGCETAGGPATDDMTALGATSGAGPMIAGSSLLLRNFMMGTDGSIDAGKIYAALILGGTETVDFNQHGAGRFRMFPQENLLEWGKVKVPGGTGKIVELEVLDPATTQVAAAVWWPENLEFDGMGYPMDTHNNVDIELYPPDSSVPAATSKQVDGVFERLVAPVSGRVGTWKLHIIPTDLVTPTQMVFWAAGMDPVATQYAPKAAGACGCAPNGCAGIGCAPSGCASGCSP